MVDDRASSNLHENLDHPLGSFLYGVSTMHCMTVSLAQGGEGLGTVWGEQKARDAEARTILESELKKAEARRADLLKEYNNGEPEKQGPEHKNYQKYLDRVAELKASIERVDQDIAGLRRELARTPAAAASAAAR